MHPFALVRFSAAWKSRTYVYGGLSPVRSLLGTELLDELVLMIEPITLGGGRTLFPNDGKTRTFKLTSAQTVATGVQVCRYQPTH
jgi:dihydrofolate reductase